MRMPILSYFIVMSVVLTMALIIISSQMKPFPVATAQVDGVPKPFTPEPDPSPYRITATNFAAPRKVATDAMAKAEDRRKPERTAKATRKPQNDYDRPSGPAWSHIAGEPIDAMMSIH